MAKWRQWAGVRFIGDPYGFAPGPRKRTYETDEISGIRYELEKRRRNPKDECTDTGYYLYGGSYFGEWCARLLGDAVDVAQDLIIKDPVPRTKREA